MTPRLFISYIRKGPYLSIDNRSRAMKRWRLFLRFWIIMKCRAHVICRPLRYLPRYALWKNTIGGQSANVKLVQKNASPRQPSQAICQSRNQWWFYSTDVCRANRYNDSQALHDRLYRTFNIQIPVIGWSVLYPVFNQWIQRTSWSR